MLIVLLPPPHTHTMNIIGNVMTVIGFTTVQTVTSVAAVIDHNNTKTMEAHGSYCEERYYLN